jgi:hypothetical protein
MSWTLRTRKPTKPLDTPRHVKANPCTPLQLTTHTRSLTLCALLAPADQHRVPPSPHQLSAPTEASRRLLLLYTLPATGGLFCRKPCGHVSRALNTTHTNTNSTTFVETQNTYAFVAQRHHTPHTQPLFASMFVFRYPHRAFLQTAHIGRLFPAEAQRGHTPGTRFITSRKQRTCGLCVTPRSSATTVICGVNAPRFHRRQKAP